MRHVAEQPLQLGARRGQLQDLLALVGRQLDVVGDEVGEVQRVLDVDRGRQQLARQVGRDRDQLLEAVDCAPVERLHLDSAPLVGRLGVGLHRDREKGIVLRGLQQPEAGQSLDGQLVGAIRQLDQVLDADQRPRVVDVVPTSLLHVLVDLGGHGQQPIAGRELLDQGQRAGPADRQRHQDVWKDHSVLQR